MRRHLLGIIAIGFLVAAVALLLNGSTGPGSICLRSGCTLAAVWLAYPQVKDLFSRPPNSMKVAIGLGLVVFVIRPQLILFILAGIAILAVFQFITYLFAPMPKRRRSEEKSSDSGE